VHADTWAAGKGGDSLSLPETLKLEVKAPRGSSYQLSERDIAGIMPDGFLIALLGDRRLRGPRWAIVKASHLSPGSRTAQQLVDCEVVDDASVMLNLGWSNWILDATAWSSLLELGTAGVRARMAWCRMHHPPRQSVAKGSIREAKLVDSLDAFRACVDKIAKSDTAAQQEGSIHQVLLEDVIQQSGYKIVENPVGVPDIVALRS
jgi:hypothetical protein